MKPRTVLIILLLVIALSVVSGSVIAGKPKVTAPPGVKYKDPCPGDHQIYDARLSDFLRKPVCVPFD